MPVWRGELLHGVRLLLVVERRAGRRATASVPRTAVAAATGGETRCVRPPLPCRPSKLRLDVDALRSRGASWSGFMPRHIEQPAPRHSAPASLKTTSRPSSSACSRTRTEPGTTSRRVSSATVRPLMISAASAQVLDAAVGARADEDGVDLDLAHRGAGLEAHVLQRLLGGDPVARRPRSRRGPGPLAPSGTPWPGLVPQVTNGVIVAASSTISSSNVGVVVGDQRLPVLDGGVPVGALRRLGRPSR